MSWLRRLLGGPPPAASAGRPGLPPSDDGEAAGLAFVCSSCGRTDLPEAGDWDPPICLECDASINFMAIEEVEMLEEEL